MKQVRTKVNVLLDAQAHRIGTAVVRMEEFKFLGNTAIAHVGYFQQILNTGAGVGDVKYSLVPMPVKDSIVGKPNVKRVTLIKAQLDGLFQMLDQDISKAGSFTDQLTGVLTQATLIQMVTDENYRKFNEVGALELLAATDWEAVDTQELVTE